VLKKIILAIDLDNEVDSLDFVRNKKSVPTRLDLIKAAFRNFVYSKQKMNPNHEFALCVLTDAAVWFQDFTSDAEVFVKRLMSLQSQGEYATFNMNSLFEVISSKNPEILQTNSINKFNLSHVYRLIFTYSRSNTIPTLNISQVQTILDSPILFFDSLYVHAKPTKTNKPQEVYDFITEIEGKEKISYYFESSTNAKKFYLHSTHLLGHPLQRPEQGGFKSNLVDQPQEKTND